MKQTTIKVPERVHAMALRLSEQLDLSISMVVDLALRRVASGEAQIAPQVHANGSVTIIGDNGTVHVNGDAKPKIHKGATIANPARHATGAKGRG